MRSIHSVTLSYPPSHQHLYRHHRATKLSHLNQLNARLLSHQPDDCKNPQVMSRPTKHTNHANTTITPAFAPALPFPSPRSTAHNPATTNTTTRKATTTPRCTIAPRKIPQTRNTNTDTPSIMNIPQLHLKAIFFDLDGT